jgi:hypothetical protein
VKFGRIRPLAPGPRLRLAKYLPRMPVEPPSSVDYSGPAATSLANILGNDALGDCVIAAGYHIVGVETGNAGKVWTPTMPQVLADYGAIGGYVPGDPSTDQGSDPVAALNYWTEHGFGNGTKLVGSLAVDPSNRLEVMVALYLFENLFIGFELPNAWVNPFPSDSGFMWDTAGDPNPNQGHQVMSTGYGAAGPTIDSWGLLGTLTWAALGKYCALSAGGDCSVLLTPDQIAKGIDKAPNGFSWAELVDDFDAIGGRVPPVVVDVVPPPLVPPGPGPASLALTLAEAQRALAAGWPT